MNESSGKTVLIIDDEVMVRNVLRRMLAMKGHEIFEATSGEAAIKMFEANPTRITNVLLDLSMPGMSGEATFDALMKINPSVSIIVTTGFISLNLKNSLLAKGAVTILEKPFEMDKLLKFIK